MDFISIFVVIIDRLKINKGPIDDIGYSKLYVVDGSLILIYLI